MQTLTSNIVGSFPILFPPAFSRLYIRLKEQALKVEKN